MPVAFNKVEGRSPQLTILGIQIDTCANELSLPPLKLARISSSVKAWLSRKAATKREPESLIGLLSHAATVVPPGRTLLRQLIDATKVVSQPGHFIGLNSSQVRSDLQWWTCFLRDYGSSYPPCLHQYVNHTISLQYL